MSHLDPVTAAPPQEAMREAAAPPIDRDLAGVPHARDEKAASPDPVDPLASDPLAGAAPLPIGNVALGWDAARRRLIVVVGAGEANIARSGPSKSGKSRVLATTHGFVSLDLPPEAGLHGAKLQLTVTLPQEAGCDEPQHGSSA